MEEILSCQQVSVGYEGKVVSKEITFSLEKGDYCCIVGENGSGKSTLFKTLLGFIKPIEGKIEWKRERIFGYLSQEKDMPSHFPATVEEIVLSGALSRRGNSPFYQRNHRQEVKDILEKFHILPLAKKSFSSLSGGQKQRVLLARALLATRDLLLLDEPVTGLDPQATEEMYQCIAELNQEGATILMISHDMKAVERYATKIVHLQGETL